MKIFLIMFLLFFLSTIIFLISGGPVTEDFGIVTVSSVLSASSGGYWVVTMDGDKIPSGSVWKVCYSGQFMSMGEYRLIKKMVNGYTLIPIR